MKHKQETDAISNPPSSGGVGEGFQSPLPRRGGGEAIVVIDNYDSFTYNLVHAIKKITGLPVDVFRNDEISLEDLEKYDKIVLSPGPGIPEEAGLLLDIIKEFAPKKSMLGVCLGHQAIGEAFGGKLHNMNKVLHGIATPVELTETKSVLFEGLPKTFEVGRYHSWIVQQEGLPDCLEVTSYDNDGFIMSMKHKEYDVQGVQFHPESVLTPLGEKMLRNWLKAPSDSPAGGESK
ncbi:MAG: aminodeoxychorismate/anthranilate synthase component II [Bacteroidia bacterium]|nr:aminodeoxychorismate/anthranilate synthase component II [Bacteroidia bacterium]